MSTKRGLAATIINCTQSRTKTGIEEPKAKKKKTLFKVHYDAALLKSQNDSFRGRRVTNGTSISLNAF